MRPGGRGGVVHEPLLLEHRHDDREPHVRLLGYSRLSGCSRAARPVGPAAEFAGMSVDTFSHLDQAGRAAMVDVSRKRVTRRIAEASCRMLISAETASRLGKLPKGDALTVARVAGVQAAKSTATWIPLAHPLPLDQVEVEIEEADGGVLIRSRVVATARTGAEMEALTACAAAALALYDMVKSVERGAVITDLRLDAKSGGARGDYQRP